MKSLKWLVWLVALVAVFSLTQAQAQALELEGSLLIRGEAFRDYYIDTGRMPTSSSGSFQYQYKIDIIAENNQKEDIVFEKIDVAVFLKDIPLMGMHISFSKHGSPQDTREFILRSGKGWRFDFETNGMTNAILEKAKGDPLTLRVTFIRQGKIVAGPYSARLPSLWDLPIWNPYTDGRILYLYPVY